MIESDREKELFAEIDKAKNKPYKDLLLSTGMLGSIPRVDKRKIPETVVD